MTKERPRHQWRLIIEGRPHGWWYEGGRCMLLIPQTQDKALIEIITTVTTRWMADARDEMLKLAKGEL